MDIDREKTSTELMAECGMFDCIEGDLLAKPYAPCAVYFADSDALDYRTTDGPHISEWINPDLEIIRDMETREIVGVRINGFSRWKDQL